VKCKNCGMTNCVSVLCKQHLAKMQAFERSEPPSAKVLSKQAKPSATIAKKTKAGKAKAVKELTEKSKEDQKNDKKVNKKDKEFLAEAGPALGPALLSLMRDPKKPPFTHAFRSNDQWKVPWGGVENFALCAPDAEEATIKGVFDDDGTTTGSCPTGLYPIAFVDGEWKLVPGGNVAQAKRFAPVSSYGGRGSLSREHLRVGLSNFTTYTVDQGKMTDYETEDYHLIVLHERANLVPEDWEEKGSYSKCYY